MKNTTLMVIILSPILVGRASAQSNISLEHKWAWSENCGWTNWQHDAPNPGDGVLVTPTHLAGFAWGENIGWINLGDGNGPYPNDIEDSSTFGVNLDLGTGELSGFAWAENVGWINFEGGAMADPPNTARLDGCRLCGFAWGENIGWINLDHEVHYVGIDCPADFDNNCEVRVPDLIELLAAWGPCPEPCSPEGPEPACPASCTPEEHAAVCPQDLDGNCEVRVPDLIILLADWGSCLPEP